MQTLKLYFIISCLLMVNGTALSAKTKQCDYQQTKNLCTALKNILGSAQDNFESIKGKIDSTDHFYTYYEPEIRIPSTESCMVRKSDYGITYFCVVGTYNSEKQANKKYRNYLDKMEKCLPEYYFEADTSEKNYNETLFGKIAPDGYDREAGSVRLVSDGKKYQIYVFFEKGLRLNFKFNKTGNSEPVEKFGIELNRLLNSCKTFFKNEKDTVYNNGPNEVSEPVSKLTGSVQNILVHGSSGRAKYESIFYRGENENDARKIYAEMTEKIKKNLPPSYVFASPKTEDEALENIEFANKISRSFDYIPVAMLKLVKNGNQYEVILNISIQSI